MPTLKRFTKPIAVVAVARSGRPYIASIHRTVTEARAWCVSPAAAWFRGEYCRAMVIHDRRAPAIVGWSYAAGHGSSSTAHD